jgi:glycosyltransferase involved in cell wall biosynthesis
MPRLSIVTISYNKGRFLRECVESVLEQDCPGIQYIVVDAGSNDGSRDVLATFSSEIDKLILEPDRGPADGLNKGFAAADAELFGYLNADDRFRPGALRFVTAFFDAHPEVDVLTGAIRIIDEAGRPQWRKRTSDAFDVRRYHAGVCTIGQQATFFRRRAFEKAGRFNLSNRIAWDGELLVDLALSGASFRTTRRVLGDFRIYGGSITGSPDYRRKLSDYQGTLERKLGAHAIRPYSPLAVRLLRMAYRVNPLRHLGYLLAR